MENRSYSVLDLNVVTWGFFAKDYDPGVANHLGVDYRIAAGNAIISHINGEITQFGGTGENKYLAIWDGKISHIFGHIEQSKKHGKIKIGECIGKITHHTGGDHLHYGMIKQKKINIANGWGWGRCPYKATRSDALARGWLDPVFNIFSRSLTTDNPIVPTIINR